ncbi:hypothetical protein LOC54_11830 [Acetobacter sp. AN02]|nr:hypothetical protein [Acetobacter sp. AN02]MDG6095759.1 hypothetical protein [Acetobacter sp. AN02]
MSAHLPLKQGSRLVLASHNKGRLAEFAALLAPYGVVFGDGKFAPAR